MPTLSISLFDHIPTVDSWIPVFMCYRREREGVSSFICSTTGIVHIISIYLSFSLSSITNLSPIYHSVYPFRVHFALHSRNSTLYLSSKIAFICSLLPQQIFECCVLGILLDNKTDLYFRELC